jgi:hypothetical protein
VAVVVPGAEAHEAAAATKGSTEPDASSQHRVWSLAGRLKPDSLLEQLPLLQAAGPFIPGIGSCAPFILDIRNCAPFIAALSR